MSEILSEDQVAQMGAQPPAGSANPNILTEDQVAGMGSQHMTEEQAQWFKPEPFGVKSLGEAAGMSPGTAQTIQATLSKGGSMVNTIMKPLAAPLRAETAGALYLGEKLGVPGFAELKQKLNPEGRILPDAYISDISDFYIDKAAKAAGIPDQPGLQGDMMRTLVAGSKLSLGLGANILMDPLTGIKVGQLTEAAQDLQKIGGTLNKEAVVVSEGLKTAAANERNLIGYRVPLTDIGFDIKGQSIQDVLAKVGEHPAAKLVGKALQALSPDTGDPVLDQAGRTHDALKHGDPVDIYNRYGIAKDALKMTSDEDRLASALVESSSNLKPDLPKKMLTAAGLRTAEDTPITWQGLKTGQKDFWADEAGIRGQMATKIEKAASKLGVEVSPGRQEAIIEAAVLSKRAIAENLMDKFHAGVLNEENIASKVMENYLPHSMDPNYHGVKSAAEYEAKLAQGELQTRKMVGGTFLSSADPTRYRTIRESLSEANAIMKEKTGLDQFFIEDPVKAQMANLIKSKKLLRDSQYLDIVKDFGKRASGAEARASGLVGITHPELEGKTVVLKQPNGSTKTVVHRDLVYPKEIASKVQYRVAPPPLTGLKQTWANYNRVFRSAIFMTSPGIRFGNAMDNVLKTAAITGKDFMQASKDAFEVLLDKSGGFRSAPTPLRPGGVFYDGQALKQLLDKFGITRTGAWSEGMESFLSAGKKLTFDQAMKNPSQLGAKYTLDRIKSMIRTVDTFGERGENTARTALFLQRLRAGYEPEQAAGEVTKWLFDYGRNSPVMENVRLVMPFMQHPFKTALIAPQLLGTSAGTYNFIQNTMPHVLANAFHDPVTQAELATILPDSIKQRDGIAGPFIPGNTWMASIFAPQGGKLGSMAWFDPRIGMRILNHFDYFSKGGTDRLIGETSPVLQGLVGLAGRGDFGKSLDYANGNVNVANRASYALSKIIGGVSPFPNTEKIIMQHFGMVDPKHVTPDAVLVMKGLAGQFGGITDLDRDVQAKLLSTHYAYMDQKKQLMSALKTELRGNLDSGNLARYIKTTYGSVTATTPVDLYKQMNRSSKESQEAALGAQALGSGMRAGDFAARMKGLSDAMEKINQAYVTMGAAKLHQSQKR